MLLLSVETSDRSASGLSEEEGGGGDMRWVPLHPPPPWEVKIIAIDL